MKNDLHNKQPRQNKRSHISFREYDENSHHAAKIIKTHAQKKANNAIDKALKRKDLRAIYDMDDYY